LIINFDTNLAGTDTVDLKITDPNGTILTVNPTNANQTFDDINISYLHARYGQWSSQGITTDGWQLGNYTFQIITEPNMARGLDACSSIKTLEICKPGITIEADKTSVSLLEYVVITVKGAQLHKITVNSSTPEHTIFPAGIEDNPSSPSVPFNDTLRSVDGRNRYVVYFNASGLYKISVRDIDADFYNSTYISVAIEGINFGTEHEDNPERKQDAWTLNTVFIGESFNITGLDPFSYVIFEKTTEPFDQYFINVDSDGCAIMESWDTLFIDEGGYNMSFVREGMSWEDREHKIVYFVEPKLTIDSTDVEGKKIESVEQGQSIMIDTGGGTSLPEDDVLAIEINGNDCRWIVGELSLSELGDYQIDTTCWMPGIYSINAETIEEKSRGLRICSNWVDLEILPTTTPETEAFDTEAPANPYPSIMGTHEGTITPSQNITVSKLYTYPCVGTGGHTKSIKLYENYTLIANGTWNGYAGDWHNITFDKTVVLLANEEYNYTIRTGSYPQIIHESPFNATGGTITCDKFIDANGRIYYDGIPAIRLGVW
jgi:hypothetical protein